MKKLLFAFALTTLLALAAPDTSEARHYHRYWGGGQGRPWYGAYYRPNRNWARWGIRQGRYWSGRWW